MAFLASTALLLDSVWLLNESVGYLCSVQFDYRNSLKVAKENNIQYIAFPAVSCGVFG